MLSAATVTALVSLGGFVDDPYEIDFFPSGVKNNNIIQLGFFGPGGVPNGGVGYTIEEVVLDITFTTSGSFDASKLNVLLVAPAGDGFALFEGSDAGWSGQGTFTGSFVFKSLNGPINPGLWTFDVTGDTPLNTYSGTFSNDTKWIVDLTPVPSPGAVGLLVAAGLMGFRGRRVRG